MKQIQIDLLSDSVNSPVVRIPGRKYPGIVLQGDSLYILFSLVKEVSDYVAQDNKEDLSVALASLEEKLKGYLDVYESVLIDNDIQLPYSKDVGL